MTEGPVSPNKKRLYPRFSIMLRKEKWQVYSVSPEDAVALGMEDAMGVTNRRGRRIYLMQGQTMEQLCDTMAHELAHAAQGTAPSCLVETMLNPAEAEEMFAEALGAAGRELFQQGTLILHELQKLAVAEEEDTVELHCKEMS
jgi:hypothetical protein